MTVRDRGVAVQAELSQRFPDDVAAADEGELRERVFRQLRRRSELHTNCALLICMTSGSKEVRRGCSRVRSDRFAGGGSNRLSGQFIFLQK